MIKDRLHFDVNRSELTITHQDNITLLGSCFSDELAAYFQLNGFNVLSNPFGTIFHPFPILENLKLALNQSEDINIYQREDLFFDWNCSGTIFGYSKSELEEKVLTARQNLKKQLSSNGYLIVTLGTAFGYLKDNIVVGNCHKAPSQLFDKQLNTIDEVKGYLQELIGVVAKFNPSVNVIFTVSPVRHVKDGIIENNRSKARLLEAVHTTIELNKGAYFPSYEIVLDDLRDYRFFKEDLVHPNKLATDQVWYQFQNSYFTQETTDLCKEVKQLKKELNHSSIYESSNAEKIRREKLRTKIEEFKNKHPEIKIDK